MVDTTNDIASETQSRGNNGDIEESNVSPPKRATSAKPHGLFRSCTLTFGEQVPKESPETHQGPATFKTLVDLVGESFSDTIPDRYTRRYIDDEVNHVEVENSGASRLCLVSLSKPVPESKFFEHFKRKIPFWTVPLVSRNRNVLGLWSLSTNRWTSVARRLQGLVAIVGKDNVDQCFSVFLEACKDDDPDTYLPWDIRLHDTWSVHNMQENFAKSDSVKAAREVHEDSYAENRVALFPLTLDEAFEFGVQLYGIVQQRGMKDCVLELLSHAGSRSITYLSVEKIKSIAENNLGKTPTSDGWQHIGEAITTVDSTYTQLCQWVRPEGQATKGYIDQRPNAIRLFLNFYMSFSSERGSYLKLVTEDGEPIEPLEFARSCHDIRTLASNTPKRPIHSQYITKFGRELRIVSDQFSPDQIKDLSTIFETKLKKKRGSKNDKLVKYLLRLDSGSDSFLLAHALQFCKAMHNNVEDEIQSMFPELDVTIGPCKQLYRITQKFEEYAVNYLQPGGHVFGRFKDLFRGTVTYDDFVALMKDLPSLEVVAFNQTIKDEYSDFKIILDILSFNFELKILPKKDESTHSHGWYELRRVDDHSNLTSFIERQILKTPVDPTVLDQL